MKQKMWSFIWFMIIAVSEVAVQVIDSSMTFTTEATYYTNNPATTETESDDDNDNTLYEVTTEHGTVRGIKSGRVIRYFDIPYGQFSAENPFEEPNATQSWNPGVLKNTAHTSRCPQIDSENKYIGDHNCLTLSIFVPEGAENADVLFHIHDSSGNTGSGDPSKFGPKHLANQGIILILPNYRIGALGFLCLQNVTAPGNAGLKDLHLALEWTNKNIRKFGGNNTNIVVSGSGFAGALVEYLILSNESRRFISKAITESGSALAPWALDRNPEETTKNLENELTKSENNAETANIYTSLESYLEKLVRAARSIDMLPCIENNNGFLTETPWQLLNRGEFNISLMTGSANHAALDKALAQQTEEGLSQINNDFSLLLPNDLKFNNVNEKNKIGRQIKTQYFGGINITTNDTPRLSQCYSDSFYLYPGIRAARLFVRSGATIYFYEFSKGNNSFNGSRRGDSLNEVFSKDSTEGEVEEATTVNPTEAATTVNPTENGPTMLTLWASFIKDGKPSVEGIDWSNLREVRQPAQEVWLSIGDTMRVQRGFHGNRLQLWEDIYQNHFIEHTTWMFWIV
ncbi:unnamed protein product [Euphydryas editha]|uniref:Carboxylesterase type B domain-containing protein n=1 Tax=Euphydryas editha TaxID=104508 RepID=A0AAU9UB13_EUPED|nr:unnamed protein product [Euphydryas editha]